MLAKCKYTLSKTVNLALVVALFVMFNTWAAQANAHDAEVKARIMEAERAASRGPYATDGVFTGSAQGFGGPVSMRLTIAEGYIDEVVIVDASAEDDAWLQMCLDLPAQIEQAQSTDLDVVSGATYTSSGILNASSEALRQSIEGGV